MTDKRWILGVCLLLTVAATGCRSARYRVQKYYRYPPNYQASTTSVQKSSSPMAAAPAPATRLPVAAQPSAAPAAATAPKPVAVPTHASPAPAAPAQPAQKTGKKSFWRFFGGSERAQPAGAAQEAVVARPGPAPTSNIAQSAAVSQAAISAVSKPEPSPTGVYRLKVGDPVVVYLRGIPGVPGGEQQIENVVGENGSIQLPYINNVNVLNMTATEAQDLIRQAYLDQQIYKHLTVNVVIPARSYYIRGEVRQPGRYPLVGAITVLQAIAAAGGYTEFASYSVEIVRGERRISLNMRQVEKRPELDQPLEPGDIIVVNRSFF